MDFWPLSSSLEEIALLDLFVPIVKEMGWDVHGNFRNRVLYLADVESFVGPLAVVPDIGNDHIGMYFQVHSRSKWAEDFIAFLEQPHKHDEIGDEDEPEGHD